MKKKEIIWAVKALLDNDSSIRSKDHGERDISNRIDAWRNAIIMKTVGLLGLSAVQPEWMQQVVNRSTTELTKGVQGSVVQQSILEPGGQLALFNGTPIVTLYGAGYSGVIDMVMPSLFYSYAGYGRQFGGMVGTSFNGSAIAISPMVDQVSGYVMVNDPERFLLDTEAGGVRPFNVETDDYPVNGELATEIVLSICTEFGIRMKIEPEQVRFNPNPNGHDR